MESTTNFFILPGNPPALHFYELWGQELREHNTDLKIRVARYPLATGKAEKSEKSDSNLYFENLTDSLIEQINEFRVAHGGNISLVGHSLGGYLALKVLNRIPDQIHACHLFHPFLRRPTPRGRVLLKVAHELHKLPSLDKWLLRIQPTLGIFMKEALSITHEEIKIFTELAFHEHLTISQDLSAPQLGEEAKSKIFAYSTKGDTWCPPQSIDSLGQGVHHVVGPAAHNFVVNRAGRDLISKQLGIPDQRIEKLTKLSE